MKNPGDKARDLAEEKAEAQRLRELATQAISELPAELKDELHTAPTSARTYIGMGRWRKAAGIIQKSNPSLAGRLRLATPHALEK